MSAGQKPVTAEVGETGKMTLLPPAPDACQVCAVDHPPDHPHNPDSLYWATARNMEGKSAPTWELGLAHCHPNMREWWVDKLGVRGVEVDVAEVERLRALPEDER